MKRFLLSSILVICIQQLNAQLNTTAIDSLYREDQLYVGLTYNVLSDLSFGFSQNNFSIGFNVGLIRDFPLNKRRNLAIGLGLGYAVDRFNQNLRLSKSNDNILSYQLIEGQAFDKNFFNQHLIEIPFEIRWRTSTASQYKFWRIYTGMKIGYAFSSNAVYEDSLSSSKTSILSEINRIQLGFTMSVGYNTWNAYLYYGLTSIFEDAQTADMQTLEMRAIKVGFLFYFL